MKECLKIPVGKMVLMLTHSEIMPLKEIDCDGQHHATLYPTYLKTLALAERLITSRPSPLVNLPKPLSCKECSERLVEFAQIFATEGKDRAIIQYPHICLHIEYCPDCREDAKDLLDIMSDPR